MNSLDPRINRLSEKGQITSEEKKKSLDQLETYEVFLQKREGQPFRHEGIVHAPDEELAWIFAKEQFSRRQTCTGLWIAKTENIMVSELTENEESVYDLYEEKYCGEGNKYAIFHMLKRGKQHVYAGTVLANDESSAISCAKAQFSDEQVFNIWVVKEENLLISSEEDKDMWLTVPEKTFREAYAYKASDKIKEYKKRNA
ncbi:MAG: phenylacetic acid degradation b [Cyclobacteriaceae bacterium]|nr:phenylacetic acid degradation b [Cyclobacteriaceae bacterium]